MPPKPKFTKEEIVAAALDIVARQGTAFLTAKHLGETLGSSARPIFTVFNSMSEVQQEVRSAAMSYFESYSPKLHEDMPSFKRIGLKMVSFAINEPKLYQLLFMQENKDANTFEDVFSLLGDTAKECISTIERDYELSFSEAKKLFQNMWIYTFGIGALCATGVCHFSQKKLSEMLTEQFKGAIISIKAKN